MFYKDIATCLHIFDKSLARGIRTAYKDFVARVCLAAYNNEKSLVRLRAALPPSEIKQAFSEVRGFDGLLFVDEILTDLGPVDVDSAMAHLGKITPMTVLPAIVVCPTCLGHFARDTAPRKDDSTSSRAQCQLCRLNNYLSEYPESLNAINTIADFYEKTGDVDTMNYAMSYLMIRRDLSPTRLRHLYMLLSRRDLPVPEGSTPREVLFPEIPDSYGKERATLRCLDQYFVDLACRRGKALFVCSRCKTFNKYDASGGKPPCASCGIKRR
jgi:hypothetical protein